MIGAVVEVKFKLPFVMIQTKSTPRIFKFESKKIDTKYQLPLYAIPIIVGAIGVYLLSVSIYAFIISASARDAAASIGPMANFLLPGINPYVPVLAGWIAILTAVVAHEFAHGIIAKINGINVKKMGLLLFLCIPIGAFVEVDETHLKASPKKSAIAVLSAGATTNAIIAVVSLILLVSLVNGSLRPAPGYPIINVEPNAPLSMATQNTPIAPGSMITAVDNTPVNNTTFLKYHPGEAVAVTVTSKDGVATYPVTLGMWTPTTCAVINDSEISQGTESILNSSVSPIRSCVGITTYEPGYLNAITALYSHSLTNNTLLYFCVPDLPGCALVVPFSYALAPFFNFQYNVEVYQTLFWLWFVNINLAIVNLLPIYGLDGGQVLNTALEGVFEKGNWDKRHIKPIVILVSLMFILMIGLLLTLPYI